MNSSNRALAPILVLSLLAPLLVGPALAEVRIEVSPAGTAAPVASKALEPLKQLTDGPGLLLPYFLVDLTNPSGETTLFAVRNNTTAPVVVRFSYYPLSGGDPGVIEEAILEANAVRTVNIRSVSGVPSVGSTASGFMIAEALGSNLPASVISGDYFRVNPDGAAANGGRLLDTSTAECQRWSHRFLGGGAFDGGTRISFLALNGPGQGPVVVGTVFDEAGEEIAVASISSDQAIFNVSANELSLPVAFGSIDWTFQGGAYGTVATTFTANSLYSVGAEAACIGDIEPPPPGTEVFELPGIFLTCNGCGNWQYDMPFDGPRQFTKVEVDFDIFIAGWDPLRPDGFHTLFWLNNGTRWQEMMGYLNARGTQNRMVFQSNGPLGNPIGAERYKSPGVEVGQSYHVYYVYDTVAEVVGYEIRTAAGAVLVADAIQLPSNVGPLSTSYTFIQFGSQPGGPVESLTEGWQWSDLRAVFTP